MDCPSEQNKCPLWRGGRCTGVAVSGDSPVATFRAEHFLTMVVQHTLNKLISY